MTLHILINLFLNLAGGDYTTGNTEPHFGNKNHTSPPSLRSDINSTSTNASSKTQTTLTRNFSRESTNGSNSKVGSNAEQECVESVTNLNLKKCTQEVSRKGNAMGGSGWKAQICMNGIAFCFKVGGSLFRVPVCLCLSCQPGIK